MRQRIGCLLLVGIVSVVMILAQKQAESEFKRWKELHTKSYSSKFEQSYRQMVFLKNLQKINKHNIDSSQTYQMGVNQFADLTQEEFASRYLSNLKIKNPIKKVQKTQQFKITSLNPLPNEIDWWAAGKASRTRQGTCGSSWAFPSVSVVESALLVAGKPMQLLSAQQLIDCSRSQGNQGCNGNPYNSLDFIKKYGISTQQQYPYIGSQQPCHKQNGSSVITTYQSSSVTCLEMLTALGQQPILVGADATNWAFYKSGIFSNCGTNINHAVVLVAWTMRWMTAMNNWGTAWGEDGMIRLSFGNTCGICTFSIRPMVYT